MIRTGICQCCLPLQGPEGLSLAHDMGYEGVEMDFGLNPSMPDLRDETTRDAFLREKEKLRIEIPSLALNYLKLNDEAEIENTRKIIRQAVEVAVKLDARVLQLCSFWGGGMRNPNEYEMTVDNLAYASQQANEYGIVVGSENQLDEIYLRQDLMTIKRAVQLSEDIYNPSKS